MKAALILAILLPPCLSLSVDKSDDRIVGGNPAFIGTFPHQVSLRTNNRHFCGGSILTPTVILTAAHCVYGKSINGMSAVAGIVTLDSGGVSSPVAQHVYHTGYSPIGNKFDIALIKLAYPLPIDNKYVRAIQIRDNAAAPGEVLTLSGWGLTSYPGSIPNQLQWINLRSIDLQTCQNTFGSAVDAGHICTTSSVNQGACQGDSGGPLIDRNGYQVGIVSFGIPCAKGYPDVFTNAPYFIDWVNQQRKTFKS